MTAISSANLEGRRSARLKGEWTVCSVGGVWRNMITNLRQLMNFFDGQLASPFRLLCLLAGSYGYSFAILVNCLGLCLRQITLSINLDWNRMLAVIFGMTWVVVNTIKLSICA
jgi:hypothetical protein